MQKQEYFRKQKQKENKNDEQNQFIAGCRFKMMRENRKVILTIPGAEIAEAVIGCGSTTGRNTDKAAKFGVELALFAWNGYGKVAPAKQGV